MYFDSKKLECQCQNCQNLQLINKEITDINTEIAYLSYYINEELKKYGFNIVSLDEYNSNIKHLYDLFCNCPDDNKENIAKFKQYLDKNETLYTKLIQQREMESIYEDLKSCDLHVFVPKVSQESSSLLPSPSPRSRPYQKSKRFKQSDTRHLVRRSLDFNIQESSVPSVNLQSDPSLYNIKNPVCLPHTIQRSKSTDPTSQKLTPPLRRSASFNTKLPASL